MYVVVAIPLTAVVTYAWLEVIRKLKEKTPGNPLSPEEHRELRKQTFGVVIMPLPEEEEQETK